MKALAKEAWKLLRQNLMNILLFELLYRGIWMPAYLRLANRMLRWALSMAGYSYLTAGNFLDFLVRPWTLLVVFAGSVLGVLWILLEAAALITAFQGAACQQRLTPFPIFWRGLQRAAEEAGRHNWRLGLVLLTHYFLVNLLLAIRCLSHIRPLNFIFHEILSDPWLQVVFLALAGICVAVALPTAFVGYGCMEEQEDFSSSLRRSRRMLKGRAMGTALFLTGVNLSVAAAAMLAYMLAVMLAAVGVVLFVERNLAMAMLLSITEKVEGALLFGAGIVLVVTHFAALTSLYHQYGGPKHCNGQGFAPYPLRGAAIRAKAFGMALALFAMGALYGLDMVYHRFSFYDDIFAGMQVTAHRGSSKTAPENTMAALAAAVEEMADWVEMDVQMTKDEVMVLGHDANLKRVAGVNRAISSMAWEELRLLDVGGWFSPEFAGERVPSLEEAMEYCKGKVNLNIEIKNVGSGSPLPEKVAGLILERGMQEQCVVTSTSLGYLERVKGVAPELRTGYILSAAYGDFYSLDAVDFISIRASFINWNLVEKAHAQGKAIHAWTVNSKSEMERMRLMGVDNLITDYPVLAREILYREEATETLMEYLQMVLWK